MEIKLSIRLTHTHTHKFKGLEKMGTLISDWMKYNLVLFYRENNLSISTKILNVHTIQHAIPLDIWPRKMPE